MQKATFKAKSSSIARLYSELVDEHGHSFRSSGWSSEISQFSRFASIVKHLDLRGKRILDVGCGVGEFLAYCHKIHIDVDYSGIDICSKVISLARRRFLSTKLYCGDFSDEHMPEKLSHANFDIVISSGLLADYVESGNGFVYLFVNSMYAFCRDAIAFNCLTKPKLNGSRHFGINPGETMDLLRDVAPYYTIDCSYNSQDATYFFFKARQ